MGALAETWSRLTVPRRVVLVAAVLGTIVTLFFIVRTASEPEMRLLFRGMEDDAAGEIVAALEQMDVPHEVRGNAIYVPVDQRDRLRVELAANGLVKDGSVGYELLDGMSGFGTTREMFRTAVKRAIEGELQRSIEAMPDVRRARIMIAMSERRPFQREEERATASVSVASSGGKLSQSTARGIRYLVALAVPGLDPDQVAVVDMEHGVILAPGEEESGQRTDEREERIAEVLRRRLEALLVNNVGAGNFTVQVTVETTREARTVSERIIDPESQSPTTSETVETTERSTTPSAAVTVASNLPDGDAAAGGGGQGETDRSTARESVAYTYSTTQREQVVEPGAIRRIGVAIVLDEREDVGPDGAVARAPRSREELQVIEQLVKAAIAFDEERGDEVEVVSLAFVDEPSVDLGLGEGAEGPSFVDENGALIMQLGVLAIVAIVLGLFVVRPILTSQPAFDDQTPLIEGTLAPPAGGEGAVGGDYPSGAPQRLAIEGYEEDYGDGRMLDGEGDDRSALLAPDDEYGAIMPVGQDSAGAPPSLRGVSETQTERLREAARDKLDASVEVLKRWLASNGSEDAGARER